MNWMNFCLENRIGARFLDVTASTLPDYLGKIGKKWLENPFPMLLTGEAGRGKTYFTMCLMEELVKHSKLLIFRKSKRLDDELVKEFDKYKDSSHLLRFFAECDFLFIDDFGMDRPSERAERDLYEIIDYRWENLLPTVISTNLSMDQIGSFYGSRILSRLKSYEWILFNGKDLRGIK